MRRKANKIKAIISISVSLCFLFTVSRASLAQEKVFEGRPLDFSETMSIEEVRQEKFILLLEEEEFAKEVEAVKNAPPSPVEFQREAIHVMIPTERRELVLEECIGIAMDNHLPLEIAKKQLELAKFRMLEAQRKLGPSATFKWENTSGEVYERKYTGGKLKVEGKQPVFYGGELVFSVRQAKTNLEIVRNDYDRIKNELILQVKKAYYSLDKAGKAMKIQEKLEERSGKLYSMARAAYEANVVAQVEVLEISSQHNQAAFQVISAREDISIANLLLQQAMNINEEVNIARVRDPRMIDISMEECFSLASLNRPEIKISQLSLEYFGYEKKIMQARTTFPRVDFLGMYGNMREDYLKDQMTSANNLLGRNPRGYGPEYYVGVKASWPLWGSTVGFSLTKEDWQPVVSAFQGTESNTGIMTFDLLNKMEDLSGAQEADLEFMRAVEEMNKKEQEITLEIKETFFKYKKAVILMNVAKSKIAYQAKQVEILEVRRQLGEAQYSDVAEEMIKLAEEEFSYIQSMADYYIAVSSLNKAIGIADYFRI